MISKWTERAFIVTILGCIQFIILTAIAMVFYTGGTRLDPSRVGYAFFLNFFSDLGRTQTFNGSANFISAFIFFVSLTLSGIAFSLFFISIPFLFETHTLERKISILSSFLGIIASLSFIAIAFTPANLFQEFHDFFVVLAFVFTFLATCCLFIITILNDQLNTMLSIVYFIFICIILIYAINALFIPNINNQSDLLLRATMQKIVIYGMISCFLVQGFYTLKYIQTQNKFI